MKIKNGLEVTREKMQWHILRYCLQSLTHSISQVSRLLLRPHSETSLCGICGRQIRSGIDFAMLS
jgi:hypothetical protein